jgi:MoxR-like ATPase
LEDRDCNLTDSETPMTDTASTALRLPAEARYAEELAALAKADQADKPAGWKLSPKSVRSFICGSEGKKVGGTVISRKFYGDDILVERAIVTLMGNRGLMMVGEPGTAKSMLSELLAAAISGDSTLTVQGSSGTVEDHIKYGWNYAMLLAEGPSLRALVPSPVYTAMREGKIARFEEITRCPPEIQDALISLLSEKMILISELGGDAAVLAQKGFNIIATANLRDRGVHEMSSALKRRFNFETVPPIRDKKFECELVRRQVDELLTESGSAAKFPEDLIDILVTTFQDLRTGATGEGTAIERPSTVMSTAEAVSVGFAAALDAAWFGDGKVGGGHILRQLHGAMLQDNPDDAKRLRSYFDVVVKPRADKDKRWQDFYRARRDIGL